MTKEQAKKVIDMVYKDEPIDKGGLFEIIDMIDEPSIQYYPSYPYTFPEKPQEWSWNIPCFTSTSNKTTIGSVHKETENGKH